MANKWKGIWSHLCVHLERGEFVLDCHRIMLWRLRPPHIVNAHPARLPSLTCRARMSASDPRFSIP